MGLKYLRRVSRFPSRASQHMDEYATRALNNVASADVREFIAQTAKAWHRPSGDVSLVEDSLLKYDTRPSKRCTTGDYLAILKKTLDELRPDEPIIPLTLGAAAKHPDFPRTTSPGFPWIHQGFSSKSDVLQDKGGSGLIHRAWDSIGRGIPWSLPDSLAYHRVVASPVDKTKVRPVWGYPVDVVLEEARFFLPMITFLKGKCNKDDTFYGLGLETALSGHSHLLRCFSENHIKLSMSADLSNFDAQVPSWIIRDVFSHMSSWFDFTKVQDSEGKIWNVKDEQTCRRWRAMVSYFVNTKIRTPSGLRVQKSSGVPSGSMFTNVIDTLVNAVQMRTAIRRVTGYLPAKDYYYGDDSEVFFDCQGIDLDALASELLDTFGAILSVEKTILTDNPDNIHWLGYYCREGSPRRPLDFIIASTLYPEREVVSPLDSCARMVGQMYSVMDPKSSVLFYDAVRHLLLEYHIDDATLETYLRTLPSKAFKYLATLGLDMSEISLPICHPDPFGSRYIPAVLPRPSPRNYTKIRDRVLPDYAFVAEAYANRSLRSRSFTDFDKYIETFSFYNEFELDEAYFSA
ncbi:RNA-dependent RNA polymerase [Metarhizium brunneum partitivirus 1]|nr:RNA-dependent RNA polymerase [Metarhizium brunneum partitivirus 1]